MPVQLALFSLGLGMVAIALAGVIDSLIRARRLRRQRALRDLAALSWQQFEEVIADAFRRHGYRVREVGGRGRGDGGVGVVLERDGQITVVQAKHWRRDRVGVQLVRELYGVQRAMQVQHSMFVAMGNYTADATQFAAAVGMTLVDGEELLRIIGPGSAARPTARQGPRAGLDFWGVLHVPCLPQNGRDPRRGAGRALTGRRFLPNEPRPLVS
jgi:restriction system protein